jgi:hypothetical protein
VASRPALAVLVQAAPQAVAYSSAAALLSLAGAAAQRLLHFRKGGGGALAGQLSHVAGLRVGDEAQGDAAAAARPVEPSAADGQPIGILRHNFPLLLGHRSFGPFVAGACRLGPVAPDFSKSVD